MHPRRRALLALPWAAWVGQARAAGGVGEDASVGIPAIEPSDAKARRASSEVAPGRSPTSPMHEGPDEALVLPRDFGSHPAWRTEWWYLTGELQAEGRREPFGFQITFFRTRTDLAPGHPSRFAAQQILFAHAAVTDLRAGRLLHDQRLARAGFGIAEASTTDTDVRLRDWHLRREGAVEAHRYLLQAMSSRFAFTLEARATRPVLRQGEAGWSRKGPDATQASWYLSEPQLAVSGQLALEGGKALPVRGKAWLDHEWSEALMHPEAVGWDWIGMNLDDGGALTAFRLRRADGSTLWTGGSLRPAAGAARSFGPDALRFSAGRTWTSPATQARYPVQWQIDTPAGRYEVVALLDAQEADGNASTGSVYWEGLSELRRDGQRVGRGYLEMTGYASRLRL